MARALGTHVRLTDPWFEAYFITDGSIPGQRRRHVETLAEAQGLVLFCPCVFGRTEGAHGLIVPFTNAPEHNFGVTARDGVTRPKWTASGTNLTDLTLSPSVDVGTPSCWHGWIRGGEIT